MKPRGDPKQQYHLRMSGWTAAWFSRLVLDAARGASLIEPPAIAYSYNLWSHSMCRNIKNLFNFEPPVTSAEVRDASLQFVRKISGFHKPSKANEAAFNQAIDDIAAGANRLLHSLETSAPAKSREEEAAKAKARSAERFGRAS
jgi:hypothetical protein